jgi:hypothetical protein
MMAAIHDERTGGKAIAEDNLDMVIELGNKLKTTKQELAESKKQYILSISQSYKDLWDMYAEQQKELAELKNNFSSCREALKISRKIGKMHENNLISLKQLVGEVADKTHDAVSAMKLKQAIKGGD